MIDKESIEKYFNLMKSNGSIADYWNFDGFRNDGDHIKIFYQHKTGKRASYRFLKERVLQELRDDKLRQLFN
jgi:hypothetical protein